mgnify:CR=1 FL=1
MNSTYQGFEQVTYNGTKEKVITPYDLEQSILKPQFDPLVGEIVTRLLQKNKWKLKSNIGADDTGNAK